MTDDKVMHVYGADPRGITGFIGRTVFYSESPTRYGCGAATSVAVRIREFVGDGGAIVFDRTPDKEVRPISVGYRRLLRDSARAREH